MKAALRLAIAAALFFGAHGLASATVAPNVTLQPDNEALADCSASVGTSAGLVLAASAALRKVMLMNVSANTIAISWTTTTPTIGGGGTYTLQPGDRWTSDPDFLPSNAIYAIAAAASSELTCSYK